MESNYYAYDTIIIIIIVFNTFDMFHATLSYQVNNEQD